MACVRLIAQDHKVRAAYVILPSEGGNRQLGRVLHTTGAQLVHGSGHLQ